MLWFTKAKELDSQIEGYFFVVATLLNIYAGNTGGVNRGGNNADAS